MEQIHVAYLGALVAVLGIGWLVVAPVRRDSNRLDKRLADQVRRSARLVDECSTTESTTFARLSTIR